MSKGAEPGWAYWGVGGAGWRKETWGGEGSRLHPYLYSTDVDATLHVGAAVRGGGDSADFGAGLLGWHPLSATS